MRPLCPHSGLSALTVVCAKRTARAISLVAQFDAAFSLLLIPVAGVVLMIVFCSKPSDSDNARGPASWHKRAREGSRKFYKPSLPERLSREAWFLYRFSDKGRHTQLEWRSRRITSSGSVAIRWQISSESAAGVRLQRPHSQGRGSPASAWRHTGRPPDWMPSRVRVSTRRSTCSHVSSFAWPMIWPVYMETVA